MKNTILSALLVLAAASPAVAQSAGDWTLAFGLGFVAPKDNNGTLAGGAATVDDDLRPTIAAEYFLRDSLGIEVLAATPFEHTVSIAGAAAGTTKHLPPTVSLVYHIPTKGGFTPFVGAGINYTIFFDEKSALGTLKLDDSFGLALKAGFDVAISDKGALRTEVRWMDIDTDATLNGAPIGTAEIDPLVFGLSYVMKF